MATFSKIGTLKVKNGTYTKDGKERNTYHEIGVLLSSPHASQLLIKMHATATSEPKLVSVFLDEGKKLSLDTEDEEAGVDENPPTSDDVPF